MVTEREGPFRLPGWVGTMAGGIAGGALGAWLVSALLGKGESAQEGDSPIPAKSETVARGLGLEEVHAAMEEHYSAYLAAEGRQDFDLARRHYERYTACRHTLDNLRQGSKAGF